MHAYSSPVALCVTSLTAENPAARSMPPAGGWGARQAAGCRPPRPGDTRPRPAGAASSSSPCGGSLPAGTHLPCQACCQTCTRLPPADCSGPGRSACNYPRGGDIKSSARRRGQAPAAPPAVHPPWRAAPASPAQGGLCGRALGLVVPSLAEQPHHAGPVQHDGRVVQYAARTAVAHAAMGCKAAAAVHEQATAAARG